MNKNPVQSKTDEKLRASRGRGGFVSAAMLCAVIILLVTGAGVLSLNLHNRGFVVRTSSDILARCSAYAGLARTFFEMNEKLRVIPRDDRGLPEVTNESAALHLKNTLLKCLTE